MRNTFKFEMEHLLYRFGVPSPLLTSAATATLGDTTSEHPDSDSKITRHSVPERGAEVAPLYHRGPHEKLHHSGSRGCVPADHPIDRRSSGFVRHPNRPSAAGVCDPRGSGYSPRPRTPGLTGTGIRSEITTGGTTATGLGRHIQARTGWRRVTRATCTSGDMDIGEDITTNLVAMATAILGITDAGAEGGFSPATAPRVDRLHVNRHSALRGRSATIMRLSRRHFLEAAGIAAAAPADRQATPGDPGASG